MLRYGVSNYNEPQDFIELLARKKGMLRKGGVPDYETAAKSVLRDWNRCVLARHVKSHTLHINLGCA